MRFLFKIAVHFKYFYNYIEPILIWWYYKLVTYVLTKGAWSIKLCDFHGDLHLKKLLRFLKRLLGIDNLKIRKGF